MIGLLLVYLSQLPPPSVQQLCLNSSSADKSFSGIAVSLPALSPALIKALYNEHVTEDMRYKESFHKFSTLIKTKYTSLSMQNNLDTFDFLHKIILNMGIIIIMQ